MNENELMSKILEVLPNAMFGTDNDGQVIIYTNLKVVDSDGTLTEFDDSNLTGV